MNLNRQQFHLDDHKILKLNEAVNLKFQLQVDGLNEQYLSWPQKFLCSSLFRIIIDKSQASVICSESSILWFQ